MEILYQKRVYRALLGVPHVSILTTPSVRHANWDSLLIIQVALVIALIFNISRAPDVPHVIQYVKFALDPMLQIVPLANLV